MGQCLTKSNRLKRKVVMCFTEFEFKEKKLFFFKSMNWFKTGQDKELRSSTKEEKKHINLYRIFFSSLLLFLLVVCGTL